MESTKPIVVTWDFTVVSQYALEHAVKISKMSNSEIFLLHIVDKGIKPSDLKKKGDDLTTVAREAQEKYGKTIRAFIEKGTIFTAIAPFTDAKEAGLVLMGTHGIKGMQKLTGSWALKVIVKSKIPFIVVQDAPVDQDRYHNIVFPVDFRSENKEKVRMAIFIGKYFDSKVHILKTVTTDKNLLKKVNTNLGFAVKHLLQNNINHEIHDIQNEKIADQTIKFAQEIKADLIVIMTTKNITFADFMVGATEQQIIANSQKIPVCCVNPMSNYAKVGQFMYG